MGSYKMAGTSSHAKSVVQFFESRGQSDLLKTYRINPGPRITTIGFLIAIVGLLISLALTDKLGSLIFYLWFSVTVIGIITTVVVVMKEKIKS